MHRHLTSRSAAGTMPITPLTKPTMTAWLKDQPERFGNWVKSTGFKAAAGSHCLLPAADGALTRVLVGIDPQDDLWGYAGLPSSLPVGHYVIDADLGATAAARAALGWALGSYSFTKYSKPTKQFATLVWPKEADKGAVTRAMEAIFLVRDLVNTPTCDMGPAELTDAAKNLAQAHDAKISVILGDALLRQKYPMVHAVGRASASEPRLIELRWGDKGPRVTLVGKGVCFDSGGLDLKPSAGMRLMKKDMGGAAHVMALAGMIMAAKLPLKLRILVPAVENAVSGNAMRPGDVLPTRKGLSVEIGNTDAEGRLVLADALAEADSEKPDLLIDFATLTGAARAALGAEVPAFFSNNDKAAQALTRHSLAQRDPVWRLPLHKPYRRMLDSKIADICSAANVGQAGAITAALFLSEFVSPTTPWLHLDILSWNNGSQPGRPEGGEAMGLRAAYALIAEMVGKAGSSG